jgi:hypothetical protein
MPPFLKAAGLADIRNTWWVGSNIIAYSILINIKELRKYDSFSLQHP